MERTPVKTLQCHRRLEKAGDLVDQLESIMGRFERDGFDVGGWQKAIEALDDCLMAVGIELQGEADE